MNKIVIINSRKIDGSIHKTWKGKMIEDNHNYWLFIGKFEKEILHPKLGIIRRNTTSLEYYFKDKWFNVFRFHEPEGKLKYFYCNINMPPTFENGVLDYVDLDIDILVQKDFSFEVLDEDEFIENSNKFKYSKFIQLRAKKNLDKLRKMIIKKSFPFSNDLV